MILTQKLSALSSEKIDKYYYLTGEEILPSNQIKVIEQAKFTYSPLGKPQKNKQKRLKIMKKTNKKKNDFNIDRDGIPLEEQ